MDMSTRTRPRPPAPSHPRQGERERGASPWLGRGTPPSATFLRYQEMQRALSTLAGRPATLAPATPIGAFMDWCLHLAASPAKQWELAEYAGAQLQRGIQALTRGAEEAWVVDPLPQDKRFEDEHWRQPPFSWLAQGFLLRQQWWQCATSAVPGVTRHHEHMVEFAARQWLDMFAPSNSPVINPQVLRQTLHQGGTNLLRGLGFAVDDAVRELRDQPPAGAEAWRVGENLAITPGRVVMRNRLIELIQYEPATPTTHPEPVFIVPAWIMKYYILDLSPHNSLVRHLVERGFTVFAVSWKNPDSGDRELGFDDYHRLGILESLDAIDRVVPGARVHALGYCLGGTLLAMAAAALGRSGSPALKTVTLLAAQTDFADPGEISLFIDESQVAHLEDRMWPRGWLDKRQMRATFQMMRSNDLVWSYRLLNYLLGERQPVTDLMAWNADGTRMPYRMHSQYLRRLFLDNALARGELDLAGDTLHLHDIRGPLFIVGTVQDHIAPWRSVFKLNALTDAEQTLVLTAGGHNVGIVNPPGNAKASYRIGEWRVGDRRLAPEDWLDSTPIIDGSWWNAWFNWLARRSSRRAAPPGMGAPDKGLPPLEAAPGHYVHQR
jgi:polyhydroxyalkanoate synthase